MNSCSTSRASASTTSLGQAFPKTCFVRSLSAVLNMAGITHYILLKALITGMLDVEATTRMTLQDVACHPWVTRYASCQLPADI